MNLPNMIDPGFEPWLHQVNKLVTLDKYLILFLLYSLEFFTIIFLKIHMF